MDELVELRKDADQYDALVFDGFSRMESAIRDYSLSIMTKISPLTPGQIKKMTQLTWPYTYQIYDEVLDFMMSIAPLVFIVTHIRPQYVGNHKTGMLEPRGQRPLAEKASLRVWTRHNPDSPAPIGLVFKRIVSMRFVDGEGIVPVNVLPRRIKPCTWKKIKEYCKDPIGDRQPTPDEVPNEFELSILDGTLTEDQKDALKIARLAAEQDANEEKALEAMMTTDDTRKEAFMAMVAEDGGLKPIEYKRAMIKAGHDVIVPEIKGWLKELEE